MIDAVNENPTIEEQTWHYRHGMRWVACEACHGTGEIIQGRPGEPWDEASTICEACEGTGRDCCEEHMTPERIGLKIAHNPVFALGDNVREMMASHIAQAIRAERERCATIVHNHQTAYLSSACGWALEQIKDGLPADVVRVAK